MRAAFVVLLSFAIVAPEALGRMRAVGHRAKPWAAPTCSSTGLTAFGVLGTTLVRPSTRHDPWSNIFTTGLTLGATPNTLYAVRGGSLYETTDGGCTWHERASVAEVLLGRRARITTRHPHRIYVYTSQHLVRINHGTIETLRLPTEMQKIEVDPADPLHLRAIALSGFVQDSHDGGTTWKAMGSPLGSRVLASDFDPKNFDHIVLHTNSFGPVGITTDGGKTWTYSQAMWWRVDSLEISPADPNVIWLSGAPGLQNAELFRSTDGGKTFTLIVDYTSSATHLGDDSMAAHPTDPRTVAVPLNIGVGIVTDSTMVQRWTESGTMEAVWSPAGTVYFIDQQIRY